MMCITSPMCPYNVLINEPSFVLHSFKVLSLEPDNTKEPSGEKQQHPTYKISARRRNCCFVTLPVCPCIVFTNETSFVHSIFLNLQSFRVLSLEPDSINEPSGEKQQHLI